MSLYLKSSSDIAAVIASATYAAVSTDRKNQIAQHFEEMPAAIRESALDVLLTTYSAAEQAFAQALFTTTPPAGGSATPTTTPTSSGDERRGVLPIPAGAAQVAIPFSPPYSVVPLPPDCQVLKAAPADDDIEVLDLESLTVNGCVALLSSATSNSNYQLSFRAVSVS